MSYIDKVEKTTQVSGDASHVHMQRSEIASAPQTSFNTLEVNPTKMYYNLPDFDPQLRSECQGGNSSDSSASEQAVLPPGTPQGTKRTQSGTRKSPFPGVVAKKLAQLRGAVGGALGVATAESKSGSSLGSNRPDTGSSPPLRR